MKIAASQDVVHWEAAAAAVAAAVRHAEKAKIKINVAVVDSGGNLAAFLRMPGGFLHSIDIAIDKAYTAAGFGIPTSAWSGALKSHSAAVQDGLAAATANGVFRRWIAHPVRRKGSRRYRCLRRVGGEDEACARAGLTAIGLAG